MKDFDGDLMRRSLRMAGEEADGEGAARRKARFEASIAKMETDPAERARIDSIAAAVGIADKADNSGSEEPRKVPTSGLTRVMKHGLRHPRRTRKQRKLATRVGDFLTWLGGGGDKGLLAQMPEERGRFGQMAVVLLTTAGIAAMSMVFALHDAVKASSLVAVILGLLWGVVILNLDRFLVMSMRRTQSRWHQIGIALPRVALATVLAVVISTPLVLRVFASDINLQLFIMQQSQSVQYAKQEANSSEGQQARQLLQKINTDQDILNGHLPQSVTSPQLQNDQAKVTKLEAAAQSAHQEEAAAYQAWQCELTGQHCSGASGLTGQGALARAKELLYQQAQANYDSVQRALQAAQNQEQTDQARFAPQQQARIQQLEAEAQQELPKLQAQYRELEAALQATAANGAKANSANTGILAQLQALSEASSRNSSLEAVRIAVLALFFLIEILPVTVRFLLNLGPPTVYETAVQLQEEQLASLMRIRSDEELRIEEARSKTRITAESDMQERERNLGVATNVHATSETARILNTALEEWRRQVRAKLLDDDSIQQDSGSRRQDDIPHAASSSATEADDEEISYSRAIDETVSTALQAVGTALQTHAWLERFAAQHDYLRAAVPGRSDQPDRYRAVIVAAAEQVLRDGINAEPSDADTNDAFRAAYPEYFDQPGGAPNRHHQRFRRAHEDVKTVLRAVVRRDEL